MSTPTVSAASNLRNRLFWRWQAWRLRHMAVQESPRSAGVFVNFAALDHRGHADAIADLAAAMTPVVATAPVLVAAEVRRRLAREMGSRACAVVLTATTAPRSPIAPKPTSAMNLSSGAPKLKSRKYWSPTTSTNASASSAAYSRWRLASRTVFCATKLTRREEEILSCLGEGYSDKDIADKLSITIPTVRTHLTHIYEKLRVQSRTEAVVKYRPRPDGRRIETETNR